MMKNSNRTLFSIIAFGLFLVFVNLPIVAYSKQNNSAVDDHIEGIARDVVDRIKETASKEVRRNTGINPLQRGYGQCFRYDSVPANTSVETQRELQKLDEKYDRKIENLNEELQHNLDKARDEFRQEAAKEDKPEKVRWKRKKLQEKVDKAYAKFKEKLAEENTRFDEKRNKILSKRR